MRPRRTRMSSLIAAFRVTSISHGVTSFTSFSSKLQFPAHGMQNVFGFGGSRPARTASQPEVSSTDWTLAAAPFCSWAELVGERESLNLCCNLNASISTSGLPHGSILMPTLIQCPFHFLFPDRVRDICSR